jgi:hypothetical protein
LYRPTPRLALQSPPSSSRLLAARINTDSGRGSWLFWRARREQGEALFEGRESLIFGIIVAAALLGLAGLVTGAIAI